VRKRGAIVRAFSRRWVTIALSALPKFRVFAVASATMRKRVRLSGIFTVSATRPFASVASSGEKTAVARKSLRDSTIRALALPAMTSGVFRHTAAQTAGAVAGADERSLGEGHLRNRGRPRAPAPGRTDVDRRVVGRSFSKSRRKARAGPRGTSATAPALASSTTMSATSAPATAGRPYLTSTSKVGVLARFDQRLRGQVRISRPRALHVDGQVDLADVCSGSGAVAPFASARRFP
jgi:hypothetical protein